MARARLALAMGVALAWRTLTPGVVAAAERTPQTTPDSAIDSREKRPVPDYDRRGDEPTTVGDVLIWIPRIVLSPLYLVSEFVVRRPLGWAISSAEEQEIPQKIVDLLRFGPDNNIGIVPTGVIDFGFRPSVGLYFFYNDFLAKQNQLRARAAFGGADWLLLNLADRVELAKDEEIGWRGEFGYRPDHLFQGLGPRSGSGRARYKSQIAETGLTYRAGLWRSSSIESFAGVRDVRFDLGTGALEDPTVNDEIARGRYPAPPGAEGFSVLRESVIATLDTRKPRNAALEHGREEFVSPPGSGVRLELRGEHAAGLRDRARTTLREPSRYEWVHYGASLGGYFDLTGQQRVLGLTLATEFADPTQRNAVIPFTEQVSLGGRRLMRGFLEDRLLDRSAAVATLEYQWPVWVWLDGTLHYAVGNVFGAHLDGIEPKLLRQSFGMGLRSSTSRDHAFELLLAFGTNTFQDGSSIDTVRILLGATSGF